MKYDVPDYNFPNDVTVAIKNGRKMSTVLLNEADKNIKTLGHPIALGVAFTEVIGKKSRLINHFRRSTLKDDQLPLIKESGYKAARAVLFQAIILDSCTWAVAQEIRALLPDHLKTIQNGYVAIHDAMEAPVYPERISRWVMEFNASINRYNPTYGRDKKIKALFRVPGMLTANEDPHQCEQALSTICAPNQNLWF